MATRKKIVLPDTLKAESFKEGDVALASGFIREVSDIETQYGIKTIMNIEKTDGTMVALFMNMDSNNNLVEGFGENDSAWLGRNVKVECVKDPIFKKNKLVAKSLL